MNEAFITRRLRRAIRPIGAEFEMRDIRKLLGTLAQFENMSDPRVLAYLTPLHTLLDPIKKVWDEKQLGIIPLVYGTARFGDGISINGKIICVTNRLQDPKELDRFHHQVRDLINKDCPPVDRENTYAFLNLTGLEQKVETHHWDKNNVVSILHALTGGLIYPKDAELFGMQQRRMVHILEKDTYFRHQFITMLNDLAGKRYRRRNRIFHSPFQ